MSDEEPAADRDSGPVPKLPRGRGFKLTGPAVFRVLMTTGMLIAILILAKPCGDAVSRFVMGFDNKGSAGSAGSAAPRPPAGADLPGSAGDYVELHPGMTDDEMKAAIERARAKAHHAAGSAHAPEGSAQ